MINKEIYLQMIIIFILALFALYILSTVCRRSHNGLSNLRGWAYAHRGLHGNGVPENSMEAFQLALIHGYGIELDVHLLSDGTLVVIHDSSLKRTTGEEGIVEDLCAETVGDYRLEGTDQRIPLFSEVLELFNGQAPLIIELKAHGSNAALLCESVCSMLDNYSGAYCLESFDPRCIRWLRRNRPDVIRGQLTENYFRSSNVKIPWVLRFALKVQLFNFLLLPDFVAYRYEDRKCFSNLLVEKLWGGQSVTWTIRSQEDYDIALRENRIPIFEGFLP